MAGQIIPAQSRRRALRLIEIKLGIIEFVFGVYRQMAVHEILRTRQRIQSYSPIITASPELIGSLSKENPRAHSAVKPLGGIVHCRLGTTIWSHGYRPDCLYLYHQGNPEPSLI